MSQPSPFIPYLGTNYTPTDRETHLLQQLVAKRKAQADALASKIEHTKAARAAHIKATEEVLAAMETERIAHYKFAEDHARLLSPIRRVPYDVLRMIFVYCRDFMDEPNFVPSGFLKWPKHISLILSHVCQGWRYLALDTPALWYRIYVAIPGICSVWGMQGAYESWCRSLERRKDMVVVWAQRSSRHPIQLKLCNSENDRESLNSQFNTPAQEQHRVLIEAICETSPNQHANAFHPYAHPSGSGPSLAGTSVIYGPHTGLILDTVLDPTFRIRGFISDLRISGARANQVVTAHRVPNMPDTFRIVFANHAAASAFVTRILASRPVPAVNANIE